MGSKIRRALHRPETETKLRVLFSKYDTDNDGVLSKDEWRLFASELWKEAPKYNLTDIVEGTTLEDFVETVFQEADKDLNNQISFDEFKLFCADFMASEQHYVHWAPGHWKVDSPSPLFILLHSNGSWTVKYRQNAQTIAETGSDWEPKDDRTLLLKNGSELIYRLVSTRRGLVLRNKEGNRVGIAQMADWHPRILPSDQKTFLGPGYYCLRESCPHYGCFLGNESPGDNQCFDCKEPVKLLEHRRDWKLRTIDVPDT